MKTAIPFLAASVLMTAACTTAESHQGHDDTALASAPLKAADGADRGKAWIRQQDGGWEMMLHVEGLPPGVHGAHLHTVGKCDAPDFTSAGAHLNPHDKMHGKQNPQGPHLGDLPNVTVGADGKGMISVSLSGTADELDGSLFDTDGTSVVVHATADDYRTDPSGNSGGRIACGVLTKG
jgi:superoxide dismutase, Cu-Zn family